MFRYYIGSCCILLLPGSSCTDCFPPCFSPKVARDHQTTNMVICHYNELPVNSLNYRFVISRIKKQNNM